MLCKGNFVLCDYKDMRHQYINLLQRYLHINQPHMVSHPRYIFVTVSARQQTQKCSKMFSREDHSSIMVLKVEVPKTTGVVFEVT